MSRKTPQKPPKPTSEAEQKARRLAEALRANLRRRKAAAGPSEADSSGKPQTNHGAGKD